MLRDGSTVVLNTWEGWLDCLEGANEPGLYSTVIFSDLLIVLYSGVGCDYEDRTSGVENSKFRFL